MVEDNLLPNIPVNLSVQLFSVAAVIPILYSNQVFKCFEVSLIMWIITGVSFLNTLSCQISRANNRKMNTVTINIQAAIASDLLHPRCSSHLLIGCIIIAINKPKKSGIKSVLPKYIMTAVMSVSNEYFSMSKPDELCITVLFF